MAGYKRRPRGVRPRANCGVFLHHRGTHFPSAWCEMTAGEVPNSERLQQIRDADAAAGEDLQMAPSAWRDRRDLLTLLTDREAALSAAVTALKVALSQWEPWEMRGWNLQKA